jgi:SOS response regulatory protein OraA/RecX
LKQKEELERLFVEAKWFYNYVLNLKKKQECKLCEINTTDIKTVTHLDKDKNTIETELQVLSSQQKQKIVSNMISNEKVIRTLVRNGY